MFESYLKPPVSFPTLTGSIVTFNSQYAGLPLKSHTVVVNAVQASGTPSPATPLPISGWSAINIENSNAYDTNIEQGTLNNSGLNGDATNRIRTADYIPVVSGHTYKITLIGSGAYYLGVSGYTANDYATARTQSTAWLGNNADLLIDAEVKYIRINVRFMTNTAITPADLTGILVTDITNYSTINLGGTYYGGEYDARTGVFTVTHILVPITVMQIAASGTFFYDITNGIASSNMLCNMAEFGAIVTSHTQAPSYPKQVCLQQQSATNLRVLYYNADYTYEDWSTFISNNPFVVCVECQPTTIQLPPCPIDTLEGVNNIWADTGNTTLQYIKLG